MGRRGRKEKPLPFDETKEVEGNDDFDEEDDDAIADPEEVEADLARTTPSSDEDEDDSDETSLDELLAQRAARKAPEESDDSDDIMTLASEDESKVREPLPSRVIPVRNREEFVCSRCHLVKRRSQLADAEKVLCRDCV